MMGLKCSVIEAACAAPVQGGIVPDGLPAGVETAVEFSRVVDCSGCDQCRYWRGDPEPFVQACTNPFLEVGQDQQKIRPIRPGAGAAIADISYTKAGRDIPRPMKIGGDLCGVEPAIHRIKRFDSTTFRVKESAGICAAIGVCIGAIKPVEIDICL